MAVLVPAATAARARRQPRGRRRDETRVLAPAHAKVHYQAGTAIGCETPNELVGLNGGTGGRERYVGSADATVNFRDSEREFEIFESRTAVSTFKCIRAEEL